MMLSYKTYNSLILTGFILSFIAVSPLIGSGVGVLKINEQLCFHGICCMSSRKHRPNTLCTIQSQPESYSISGVRVCFKGYLQALFITAGSNIPGGRVDGKPEYCQVISLVPSFIPRIVVKASGSVDGFS